MGVVSGIAGAGASIYGASQQADAAKSAQAMQWKMYSQMRGDLSPFMQGGAGAFGALSNLMGQGGPQASANMLAGLRNYPGYQFALQQGQQGLDRSMAARGLGLSGGEIKDSMNYNQGMADQLFGNYYNQLSGMANLGESAAAGVGSAGMGAATNAGQSAMAGANAWAGGAMGAANNLFGNNGALQSAQTEYGLNWGSLSDRRAKTDVRKVGRLDSGLPVYSFKYRGSDLPQIGVMADEVERVAPHAVRTAPDGFKRVDYGMVSRLPPARAVSHLPAMRKAA